METLKKGVLVVLVLLAAGAGCARRTSVVKRPIQSAPSTTPRLSPAAEVTWGPVSDGLQCRLRPIKRVYAPGESPAFKIDLRNRGGRVFAFFRGEQAPVYQFSIDGQWHRWPTRPPTEGKVQAFGPGVEFLDLPVTLPPDARPLLTPGPHTVQLAFSFEGVKVVSNPVEIEISESHQ